MLNGYAIISPADVTSQLCVTQKWCDFITSIINSLAPRCNFKCIILKFILANDIMRISCEIALRWMPQDLFDFKSTLVQVITWHQATNWINVDPSSLSLYYVTRDEWVNSGDWILFLCMWRCDPEKHYEILSLRFHFLIVSYHQVVGSV